MANDYLGCGGKNTMTYTGHVENGMIVLDNGGAPLPEGARVRVEVHVTAESEQESTPPAIEGKRVGGTLHDLLKEFIGVVDDMPSDLARNHDHYLYGAPKK